LPVFDKPDSTGICLLESVPSGNFSANFLEHRPGPIESPEGEVLGTHQGWPFTLSASAKVCISVADADVWTSLGI